MRIKNGFTLVELSIVLVIIGLLIGGILAAQSMINTTKIQAQVRQIQQLDAAITNFQTKYNQLPGDGSLLGGPGNNDGIVSPYPNPADPPWPIYTNEVKFVWPQLKDGVSLYRDFTFDTTDYCNNSACSFNPSNAQLVPAKINNKTGIMVSYDGASFLNTNFNAYNLTSFDSGDSAIDTGTPTIAPADGLAIDTKIDDGNPNSGNVWASTSYDIANPGNKVIMEIKILSQTGQ